MTSAARYLVVNADDFGQSAGVNAGIVEAHRNGVVTSASLMVRWPDAIEAGELSRACPGLGVGLHLDLGEWYLEGDAWQPHYEVVSLDDPTLLSAEVDRQLEAFSRLTGRGPTHIDSHQHVHLREPVRTVVERRAGALGIPLRRCREHIRYCGEFYGQDEHGGAAHGRITVGALLEVLARLPPGISELCCHPAAAADLDTMYAAERMQELQVLCDPRIRRAIETAGIVLCSFEGLPDAA